jgi:hypothetical protein
MAQLVFFELRCGGLVQLPKYPLTTDLANTSCCLPCLSVLRFSLWREVSLFNRQSS